MSRSDNNKNSIFDFAKTLLGQKPGGVCRIDERYDEYVTANSPTEEQLAAQRRKDFSGMPVIAVAIAGEDGDKLRRLTEDSVKEQTYSRWIISKSPKTDEFDFIMYMWPGDILRPDALYTFAKNTEGNDLIFCDEDRLEEGQRCDPLFKPCMDRVTQYSFDMLGRGVMVSRALFEASGGMTGVTGCDRYAYNLRLADRCSSACHIQQVLYTAHDRRDIGPKGRQVLENHLKKNDDIRVFPGEWRGSFRVEAIIRRPSAAIVIYNKNSHIPLMRMLNSMDGSLRGQKQVEIIIADGGSTDGQTLKYYDILRRNGAAKVFCGKGMPMPALLNAAAKEADRENCLFMDSNVEALGISWLYDMLSQSERRGCGGVGPKLIGQDGRLVYTGITIGIGGWQGSPYAGTPDDRESGQKLRFTGTLRTVSALSWVCMMTPMNLFFNAGCFDESFNETGFDTEYCTRLDRRGYSLIYAPNVVMKYHGRIQKVADADGQDRMRYYDTVRDTLIRGDPRYNNNFDYALPSPRIAVRPRPAAELNELYRK